MTVVLVGLLRFTIGFALLLSGAFKLRDPRRFSRGVAAYRIVGGRTATVVAVAVVCAELAAAVGLLSGVLIVAASALAAVLGLVFATAVGIVLWRGQRVACNCFGGDERVSSLTLLRAGLLTAASAVLLALLGVDVRLWSDAMLGCAAAGLALAVCVVAWGRRRPGPERVNTGEWVPLAPGSPVPSFRLPRNDGPDFDSETLRGRRTVLGIVIPKRDDWDTSLIGLRDVAAEIDAALVVVCLGPAVKCPAPGSLLVLCDQRARILQALRVKQVPIAVVVDEEWRVSAYGSPTEPASTRWRLDAEPPLRDEVP